MMGRISWELGGALVVIAVSAAWYAFASRSGAPAPGGAVGHALGIVGFMLMLAAEIFYTLRKRRTDASWGPTRYWLRIHIFVGLVGPWLVMLHTAGRFNGIAGVTAWLMILVVVSGFVGRFIYTSAPRTLDGTLEDLHRLEKKLAKLEGQLPGLGISPTEPGPWSLATETPPRGWWIVLTRRWLVFRKRHHIHRSLAKLRLSAESRARLEPLLVGRYRLWLDAHSLIASRQMLASWQLFHVPLAGALFVLAFAHIIGAMYYSTLSK